MTHHERNVPSIHFSSEPKELTFHSSGRLSDARAWQALSLVTRWLSRRSIPTIVALACVGLSGCARDAIPETDRGVAFDPISFFEGRTHGEGELRKLFGKPVHVSVDSMGRPAPGGLILDQIIREEGEQPSVRHGSFGVLLRTGTREASPKLWAR